MTFQSGVTHSPTELNFSGAVYKLRVGHTFESLSLKLLWIPEGMLDKDTRKRIVRTVFILLTFEPFWLKNGS